MTLQPPGPSSQRCSRGMRPIGDTTETKVFAVRPSALSTITGSVAATAVPLPADALSHWFSAERSRACSAAQSCALATTGGRADGTRGSRAMRGGRSAEGRVTVALDTRAGGGDDAARGSGVRRGGSASEPSGVLSGGTVGEATVAADGDDAAATSVGGGVSAADCASSDAGEPVSVSVPAPSLRCAAGGRRWYLSRRASHRAVSA
jgi:hypothetical protein